MTRSVADAALALGLMAGHDQRDPTSSTRPVEDYVRACATSVRGLRVGIPKSWFLDQIHPDVAAAFDAAVHDLEETGVTLTTVDIPSFQMIEAVGWTIMYGEMSSLHEGALASIEDRDAACGDFYAIAPFVTASDYLRAARIRPLIQREVESAFQDCDVIATPGAPSVAPLLEDMACDVGDKLVPWLDAAPRMTMPWNVTGNPALTVPAGLVGGLPVSLQLVGRPYAEGTILALGGSYERLTGHHLAQPDLLSQLDAMSSSPKPTTQGVSRP
jgi:aspartyl-tRNA(Asn)/glutamyl-tRNA(Gln) amidotransferase subunit A